LAPQLAYAAAAAVPPRTRLQLVKTKKNIHFEFSQDLVREPLLYKINRSFDVVVNIRGASVTADGGFIALELEGEEAEVERVLEYLRGQGVRLGEGLGSQER
jgi:ABC-type methionine transport system ATPase subunit